MKHCIDFSLATALRWLFVAACLIACRQAGAAEEYAADFRGGQFDKRVLKTTGPAKYLEPTEDGLRIEIPAEPGAENAGVQFPLHLTGDSTLQATIEIIEIPTPTGGYGTGIALLLEDGIDHGASLQRIRGSDGSDVYIAHNFIIDETGEYQHEGQPFPAAGPRATLRMRREGKELIYEVSEDDGKTFKELRRIEFSDRPLRAVQVYGQTGDEPNALSILLKEMRVVADKVIQTGPSPPATSAPTIAWWQIAILIVAALLAAVGIRWVWHRWES